MLKDVDADDTVYMDMEVERYGCVAYVDVYVDVDMFVGIERWGCVCGC